MRLFLSDDGQSLVALRTKNNPILSNIDKILSDDDQILSEASSNHAASRPLLFSLLGVSSLLNSPPEGAISGRETRPWTAPGRVLNRLPPGHVPAPDGGAAGFASSHSMAGNTPAETPPPSRAGGGWLGSLCSAAELVSRGEGLVLPFPVSIREPSADPPEAHPAASIPQPEGRGQRGG